jgi:hypothetical protein
MSKSSQLYALMSEELPNITYQKRLTYRTSQKEVLALFKIINKEIFNNKLPTPKIEVMGRCRKYWGLCTANDFVLNTDPTKSDCVIRLMDKWFCKQWLISTLAHEMCHQYQWDIYSRKRVKNGQKPIMSHGPSFFLFRDKLAAHGISLKRSHGMKRWFRHQCFTKC